MCRVDYRNDSIMKLPGNKTLKQSIKKLENLATDEVYFYMKDGSSSSAYLAIVLASAEIL